MNRMLSSLSLSALVAGLMAIGPAWAADGIADETVELERGGYFLGSVSVDGDNLGNLAKALEDPDAFEFDGDHRVLFEGFSNFENGLRYGFRAEVNVADPTVANAREASLLDQAYLYVDGGFGRVELGQQSGVSDQFSVRSPNALNFGSESVRNSADSLSLSALARNEIHSEDARITYMTPSFGGLKLGVSFAPEKELHEAALDLSEDVKKDDVVEFGVIYSRSFEDLSVDMSASYVAADATRLVDLTEREEWNAGVSVGFRGLSVGGSYREGDGALLGSQKYEAYDVGVAFESGAWKVAAQFGQHEGAAGTEAFENGSRYLISARYKVAKGLRIGAGFQKDMDVVSEEEGSAFILESALKF